MPRSLTRKVLGIPDGPEWVATTSHRSTGLYLDVGTDERDVTDNLVVSSLQPLTLTFGHRADDHAIAARQSFRFVVRDSSGKNLVSLTAKRHTTINGPNGQLTVVRPVRTSHHVTSRRRRIAYHWYQRARQTRSADWNLRVRPADLPALYAVYFIPRPVVLVSVQLGGQFNIFPMDLISTVTTGDFVMCLRKSSPAHQLLRDARRVALSHLSVDHMPMAYQLGAHHGVQSVEPETLSFPVKPSDVFGVPVPVDAMGVREVEITDYHHLESHTMYIAKVIAGTWTPQQGSGAHIHCWYDWFLRKEGRTTENA